MRPLFILKSKTLLNLPNGDSRMKRLNQKKASFFVLFIFWFLAGTLFSQTEERYFDTAELSSKEVRLAILFPSVGSIRVLIELRDQGFITLNNLTVIGVYHEKERTNYKSSISYVERRELDWIKFHKLSGELNKDNLFEKNPCTADFEQIFQKSDGVIFFGGADIPPYIYRKKTSLLTRISTPLPPFPGALLCFSSFRRHTG